MQSSEYVTGWDIGAQLCNAIGLKDKPVRNIDIKVHLNELVTARVEIQLTKDQVERVIILFKTLQPEEQGT